jgi:hypothetical protein
VQKEKVEMRALVAIVSIAYIDLVRFTSVRGGKERRERDMLEHNDGSMLRAELTRERLKQLQTRRCKPTLTRIAFVPY